MPDQKDLWKQEDEHKAKKAQETEEHRAQFNHDPHAHDPLPEVEIVTAHHATHEHGLQNKEINKQHREEVNIHSDDKNERHTHAPKAEQFAHDLKWEEAKKA